MEKHKGDTTMINPWGYFWLALALVIITCSDSPDLLDAVIFKLYEGHPEKQEILWKKTLFSKKSYYEMVFEYQPKQP